MRRSLVLLVLTVLSVCACKSVSSYMHDGEVVAKVGKHKLYAAELEEFIPGGVSTEDSTRLALQYINNCAEPGELIAKYNEASVRYEGIVGRLACAWNGVSVDFYGNPIPSSGTVMRTVRSRRFRSEPRPIVW